MSITDETIARLRSAADAGDPHAALNLGKLLCLTSPDVESGGGTMIWPEEPWLRAAVEALPDDVEALTLLTGRLAEQIDYWENDYLDVVAESGEDVAGRLRDEAEELYTRIRAAGPHGDAEAGLAELAVLLGVGDGPAVGAAYSFYVLEDEGWSGSVRYNTTIVACDADEIRWAGDEWLKLSSGGFGGLALTAYADGAEVSSIDLREHVDGEAVSWDAVAVPALTGPRLPAGLPVPGNGLFYGFSGRAD